MKRATGYTRGTDKENDISIHALVKRATYFVPVLQNVVRNFNPRPREEGDVITKLLFCKAMISIHALVKRATKVIGF